MTPLPTQPPQHTDACIRDAARYGFCDHTRLFASPANVRRHDLAVFTEHRARNITGWLALGLLTVSQVLMFLTAPLWLAFAVTPLQAFGWSGLYAAGLPTALSADHTRNLPGDVLARLALNPPYRPRRSKKKGRT